MSGTMPRWRQGGPGRWLYSIYARARYTDVLFNRWPPKEPLHPW